MSKKTNVSSLRANKKKIWITVGVIALVAIIAVSFFTSPAFLRTKTAGTVGGTKVTEAEFAYYYQTTYQDVYNQMYQTYGEYVSYFFDTNKSLDEQFYAEGITWNQYITDTTCSSIEEIYAICAAANKAGYTLSESEQATIASALSGVEASAAQSGYSTELYLRAIYGHGMNLKLYEKCITNIVLADSYANEVASGFVYTDEHIDEYYEANRNDFDTVSLRMMSFPGEVLEDGTVTGLEDALAKAEEMMAAVSTEEEFSQYAIDFSEEDEIKEDEDSLYIYVPASQLTVDGMDAWFFEEERTEGDMKIFADDDAYFLAYYIARHDIDYNTVNMRHILVEPVADENGEYSEESLTTALETIETYFNEWEASDRTEETFANMADVYSSDAGSNTTGGLYTDIYKGQMTHVVNDWLFDEENGEGDYTILQSGYGYHLILHCGEGDNYKTTTITDALIQRDYQAWYDGIVADLDVSFDEDVYTLMLG